MHGLNQRATIRRIAKDIGDTGDAVAAGLPAVVAANVRCAIQATRQPQSFLLSGQVTINTARVWFKRGTDVRTNDFLDIKFKGKTVTWTVEGTLDEAGRGHHILCEVKQYV